MESKTEGTMRKSIENWVENWCQKIVYILLGVIILKNKQCLAYDKFEDELSPWDFDSDTLSIVLYSSKIGARIIE